jgi:hypothetical protein
VSEFERGGGGRREWKVDKERANKGVRGCEKNVSDPRRRVSLVTRINLCFTYGVKKKRVRS